MRIAIINMTHSGSTGNIMLQIASQARAEGHQAQTFSAVLYQKGKRFPQPPLEEHTYWGSHEEAMRHYYLGCLLGANGLFSKKGTRALISRLEAFRPDVVHLHNLHDFCIHLPTLFSYIRKNHIPVVWTLHDCWAFTGGCPHFQIAGCDRWRRGCGDCPQLRAYPKAYVDTTRKMLAQKKKWYEGVENLTVAVPSQWLAELVKRSVLADCPVRVIGNGIDLKQFQPVEENIKAELGCQGKFLLLGVASDWSDRKGLDVFNDLAQRLEESYQIVLVGTDSRVAAQIHKKILTIPKTNPKRLAQLYCGADLFVNPTREDTYPTVNMEALACGTPVLTFRTGGSPEIPDESCGCVVDCDDVDAMERQIRRIRDKKPYTKAACLARAKGFDGTERFAEYIALYQCCCERKV